MKLYHKLVRNSINILFFFVICCLITDCMSDDQAGQQQQHPLQQMLSSRKDLVQIAGYGEEKISTVLITGSVHCEEACGLQSALHARPVSGAVVSVNCRVGGRKWNLKSQGRTDEYGDFMIELPSELHAVANLDKLCCARVTRVPKKTQCKAAFVKRHKGLKLSSVGNGIRTYSAGTPQPPNACIKKTTNNNNYVRTSDDESIPSRNLIKQVLAYW